MISEKKISEAVRLLVQEAGPVKIILFGSYAKNQQHSFSDIDFLVVETQVKSKIREMIRLQRVLKPLKIPVDILVVSMDELEQWGHLPGTALYWALKEGKVLHEKAA